MNADESGQEKLFNDGNSNSEAVWSPDRRHLAFQVYDAKNYRNVIYCVDSDGSHRTALVSGSHPVWSPDGKRIAFVGSSGYGTNIGSYSPLVLMNPDGANKVVLSLVSLNCSNPVWSPNGRQLAFFSDKKLYKVNADGSNLTRLLTDNSALGHVSWSPDGKTLAFDSSPSYAAGIYTMTTGGSTPVRVTPTTSWCTNPIWSPDGTRIVYSFLTPTNPGIYDLYSMKADGSDARQLTNTAANEIATDWKGAAGTATPTIAPTPTPFVPPVVSGVGKLLYSVTKQPSSNDPEQLLQVNVGSSSKKVISLSSNLHLYSGAVWNRDASKIAFIAVQSPQAPNLWIANADGSNAHSVLQSPSPYPYPNTVPSPNTATNCDPTWSPDGRFLAYIAPLPNTSYENALWVVGVDGSNPRQITSYDCYGPVWSPDGTRIAFSSKRDDPATPTWQLFTIKPDGTDLTRIFDTATLGYKAQSYPTGSCDYPAWSPDGRQLAFINTSNWPMTVWSVGVSGASPRKLVTATSDAAPFHRPAWSPDGKRIAFSLDQNRNRTDQIQVVNADGTGYGVLLNDGARDILSDWKSGSVPASGAPTSPASRSSSPAS